MIKFIALREVITIPGRADTNSGRVGNSTLSTWNVNENSKSVRVEETPDGFKFILGHTNDKGAWVASGDVVEVYRHMVKWVTRGPDTAAKEQRK